MQRRIITSFFICCTCLSVGYGQFGAGLYYGKASVYYPLQNEGNLSALNENGFKIAANYWFRLKNFRIEFFPEFAFSYYPVKPFQRGIEEFSVKQLSLLFPVQLYPLDWASDCRCPTFSKQSTFLRKGLFVQVVPAAHRAFNQTQSSGAFFYSLGLGLGIDLGFSDLVTLSPILAYHYYPDNQFPPEPEGWIEEEIHLGLRMIVRPDY